MGKIIDFCASNRKVIDWLVKPVVILASKKYAHKVLKSVPDKDRKIKKEVLLKSFSETKIFVKYKEYVPSIDYLLDML